jgi:hypothetical protein
MIFGALRLILRRPEANEDYSDSIAYLKIQ